MKLLVSQNRRMLYETGYIDNRRCSTMELFHIPEHLISTHFAHFQTFKEFLVALSKTDKKKS